MSGGGYLNTSWTPPTKRAQRIGEYKTALNLKKPLVFYAQSFGPFASDDPFAKQLLPILKRADAVLCRDEESVDILTNQVGVSPKNILTTIDEALLLRAKPPSRLLAPPREKKYRVGVCVHQWMWEKVANHVDLQSEFERKISLVCRRLIQRDDVEIALISTHQGIERALHSDEEVVTRIYYQIPEILRRGVHCVEGFVHPEEYAYFMGHCDLVISSRLHGAILSLIGGAPTIALGYEPKTLGLLKRIGLEDWHLSMWDFEIEELLTKGTALLENSYQAQKMLNRGILEGRNIALLNREAVRCAAIGKDLPRNYSPKEKAFEY